MKLITDFLTQFRYIITPVVAFGAVTFMIFGLVILFTDWRRSARILVKIILPLIVIAAAGGAAARLIMTRSEPDWAPAKSLVVPVTVRVVKLGSHKVSVPAMASVTAARTVVLKPEVTGRIVEQCPQLVPGGLCKEGMELVKIDPRDYEHAVDQAQAEVDQAGSQLELEEGRQIIAKREWDLLRDNVPKSETSEGLALRKPQLTAARAGLAAAESRLKLAKLHLERTTIYTPFNAVVTEEKAEFGQVVDRATTLATLIGTDQFWLRVSIPLARLRFVILPDAEGEGGSRVRIIQAAGDGEEMLRDGRVIRLLGDMDKRSRMARLLVEVDDPLGLKEKGRAPLFAGSYVRVEIEGRPIERAAKIPRAALREGGRVWIMDADDKLEMRKVEVAWQTRDSVLVHAFDDKNGAGIRDGERIVMGLISAPVPGMVLRVASEDNE